VSSYQLETVETFHPAAAVILNVTPDHLERHGSMEGYLRAKAAVFGNQDGGDTCVLNAEDEFLMTLSGSLGGREMLFSRTREVGCGAFAAGGDIILAPGGDPVRVVGTDELSLRGRHNLSNALAVICMASAAGLRPWEMVAGLRSFAGVPHRIESVAVHDGVEYVNDSKSTNVDSLRVALESFSKPVVLLAGGQAKDTDYSVLRTLVTCMTSRVVLFGRDAGRLLDAWKGSVPITVTSGLEEALATAVRDAVAGDVILLSPGCASFDQYRNFEERGEHFRRLVEALP
jgi:UDP-N-acetylmuramoylalanine--D-glutamate ligase